MLGGALAGMAWGWLTAPPPPPPPPWQRALGQAWTLGTDVLAASDLFDEVFPLDETDNP